MYFAINKHDGSYFVGKRTQTGYTELRYLKTAITYQHLSHDDYTFFKLDDDFNILEL